VKPPNYHPLFRIPKAMKNNLKTTVLGVVTIVAAISNAILAFLKTGSVDNFGETVALIAGGYGLIKAADAK
jgi:hypothetical protein